MGKFIDLTGKQFGRLTVIRRGDDFVSQKGHHRVGWLCSCSCGNPNLVHVRAESLKCGETKSCGCLEKENLQRIAHRKGQNRFEWAESYIAGFTSNGERFIFDKDDYEKVMQHCWHSTGSGYIVTDLPGKKSISLHRYLMNATQNEIVDHTNHDVLDNRRCNLRIVSRGMNNSNRAIRSDNTTGVSGVFRTRNGKWTARIGSNGSHHQLGTYDSFSDAVAARKAAEEKYFGSYSYDNSIAAVPRIAV